MAHCSSKLQKKKKINVLIVVYCVRYIILLCCLYYFNVLNINIKPLLYGVVGPNNILGQLHLFVGAQRPKPREVMAQTL